MHKISSGLGFLIAFLKYIVLFLPGKLIYSKRKIWLFCERGDDANDNSFHFFKWVNKNHPEINSVYLLSKNSTDAEKVLSFGKICRYGSLKHWLMFIGSSVRLSTHLFFYVPNKYLAVYFMKYHKKSGVDVFLQHGITYNWQDCFFKRNNKSDIVVCGAKPEYEYLLNNFDLGEHVLKFTGFPRYDSLINNPDSNKKFILILPTWRTWLSKLNDNDFANSDFFISYKKLINDNELLRWAKINNFKIVFYLHPSFYKFRNVFFAFSNEITLVAIENFDIQQLMCSASLMVTDYSSVMFDFAYLRKPTVYFHFDSNVFYSKQYKHGYFLIDQNGFGPVEKDIDGVVNQIKNNIELKQKYANRINDFFDKNDKNNCLRVYNEIMNKL